MTTNQFEGQIRKIHADDKHAWLKLWKAYLEFYEADVSDAVTAKTWDTFFTIAGHNALIAESGAGETIGFVTYLFHPSTWTATGYCYLEDLFVAQASRGIGAGRALIEAVVETANESSVGRVYWHTDTGNTTARKLYDSAAELSDMVQYRIKT